MDNTLSPQKAGTLGGTALVLLTLSGQALLETAVLAAVGAAVSYGVSLGLKVLGRRWRKR